jgi:hypothetical protein
VRATLGGIIERSRYELRRYRVAILRSRLVTCPHCGSRNGRHTEDCVPF